MSVSAPTYSPTLPQQQRLAILRQLVNSGKKAAK